MLKSPLYAGFFVAFYQFYAILIESRGIIISIGYSFKTRFTLEIMEVLEYLFHSLCGFRYIFSRKYRSDAHVRWQSKKI